MSMTPDEMIAVIQAFKDGKKIESRSLANNVHGWVVIDHPSWGFSVQEYRIKPEPKPDVVQTFIATLGNKGYWHLPSQSIPANLRLTFDGETGKLKSAEVVK